MKFGPVPVAEAEGAILAHSVKLPGGRIGKGSVLEADDLARLAEAGMGEVVVARLEEGDVGENASAARLARAIGGAGLKLTAAHTGRVNLKAEAPGVLVVDAEKVRAINAVDPGITLATLAPLTRVTRGLLAGTVKMIPYAVPGAALEAACSDCPPVSGSSSVSSPSLSSLCCSWWWASSSPSTYRPCFPTPLSRSLTSSACGFGRSISARLYSVGSGP